MIISFLIIVSPYWIIQYNNIGAFSLSGKGLSAIAYGFIINQGGNIERAIYDGTRYLLEQEINNVGILNYILNNKFLFFKVLSNSFMSEVNFNPNFSSTSADPDFELIDLFPCFAT